VLEEDAPRAQAVEHDAATQVSRQKLGQILVRASRGDRLHRSGHKRSGGCTMVMLLLLL